MKKFPPVILIFITVLLLYYPTVTTYFSHDDFFMFKLSRTDGSLQQFFNLFGFHPFSERGIAFYRPIFREFIYHIYYLLFGLNHTPFRIISLFIHFVNIWLVFKLIKSFFQKNDLAFFVALFFGISTSNVAILYYLAGGIEASGATTFSLLTIIFYINLLRNKKNIFSFLSFTFYLLALASHEIAALTPLLLVGIIFVFFTFKESLTRIIRLWPYFLILLVYLYFDINIIGFSGQEKQYQVVFNIKTLFNSLVWYSGWALGLPEMLIDFVMPSFRLNPNLMRYWGNYFIIIFASFTILILILGINLIKLLISKRSFFQEKKFWFFVLWFPITLFPVIFLPSHKSSYYLSLSLPALWTVIGLLVFSGNRVFKIIFIASALILSLFSTNLATSTYPAATRGKLAQKIIKEITATYPDLPKGSVIYFTNDPNYPYLTQEWGGTSRQVSLILNGNDALQLLYNDPTLKVFYEDLGGIPKEAQKEKILKITAKVE